MHNLTVYTLAHNEAHMVPYFIRHYSRWADHIVIYDDSSDDGTPEIAADMGAEVRPYTGHGLDDMEFVEFADRESQADRHLTTWAIWVDADEFIYHDDLTGLLTRYMIDGVTVARCIGWNMVARWFPDHDGQIYDNQEFRHGVRMDAYSKPAIFRPSQLTAMRWGAGKHDAHPEGNVRWAIERPVMLHYRSLGYDYILQRDARNAARMSQRNIDNKWGWQVRPEHSKTQLDRNWDAALANRVKAI